MYQVNADYFPTQWVHKIIYIQKSNKHQQRKKDKIKYLICHWNSNDETVVILPVWNGL